MAFFSVILLNLIFWILLGIFVIGAVAFLVSIISAVLYLKSRKRPDRFRSRGIKKIVSIVSGILALLIFCFFGVLYLLVSRPKTVSVETAAGTAEVLQSQADDFVKAIQADDTDLVAGMLAEAPELNGYITHEGYNPLGAAIRYDSPRVAAYLLDAGADVNRVGGAGSDTAIALVCSRSINSVLNVDMLNLLLDYQPDVCRSYNVMPPVQYVIRYSVEDNIISEEDLQLLERFLQAGADLAAENGTGKDSEEYLQFLLDKSTVPEEQSDKILTLLRRYRKSNTPQQADGASNLLRSERNTLKCMGIWSMLRFGRC